MPPKKKVKIADSSTLKRDQQTLYGITDDEPEEDEDAEEDTADEESE